MEFCEKTQKIHSFIGMVKRLYCGRTDRNLKDS